MARTSLLTKVRAELAGFLTKAVVYSIRKRGKNQTSDYIMTEIMERKYNSEVKLSLLNQLVWDCRSYKTAFPDGGIPGTHVVK